MRLTGLGIDRDIQTVVVLGAGASRGSACARQAGLAPPLDADFFAQAQRMPGSSLEKRDRELFAFIRSEFGQAGLPTLEVFFTQIAAVDRFHHEFNIRGRVSGQFGRHLATLQRLIPRVFKEALGDRHCIWHERLAASLRTADAVMSFNYDTLIDQALAKAGGKRWLPEVGYGFSVTNGAEAWKPPSGPGPNVKHPVQLLKPHGSLNWHVDKVARTVELVDSYHPSSAGSIVPPTWDKSDVGQWPWSEVWRGARRKLGTAKMLVVIGYSVPTTDQLSQALLRADVTKLDALVVVNPDPNARRRVSDVMSSGLGPNAVVIELATLQEFASYLPAGPNEAKSELELLRDALRNAAARADRAFTRAEELETTVRETISDMADDLDVRLDELDIPDVDHLEAEIEHIRNEVQDLEARIESMIT